METIYFIGLDVHKETIAYCIKKVDGKKIDQVVVSADRASLSKLAENLHSPLVGAMKATLFTGWIYDFLQPFALELKVAHPEMLKAIVVAKKKNDRDDDAERITDLLRVNLLPETYMMPTRLRDLRRMLRYRNLIVRTAVRMKNKMSGLLMEVGAQYDKRKLHGKRYFHHLMESIEYVPDSIKDMLRMSRGGFELFDSIQKKLVRTLRENPMIRDRVRLLMTIPGMGEIRPYLGARDGGY